MLPTLRELGIGLVAYSPLGRGFLTGQIKSPEDLAPDDFRRHNPRFQGENLQRNLDLVRAGQGDRRRARLHAGPAGAGLGAGPGQDVVPIPGTKRRTLPRAERRGLELELSRRGAGALDEAAPAAGAR